MGLTQSKSALDDTGDNATPLVHDTSPGFNSPRRPKNPTKIPKAPTKPTIRQKYYLFLDIDTTFETTPQLVALNAVLYKCDDNLPNALKKQDAIDVVVKPTQGSSILCQLHETRYHGVTIEHMATHGKDVLVAVTQLIDMVRKFTGDKHPNSDVSVTILGYGLTGMLADLMNCAKANASLHPLWEDLEALCQHSTEDLLDTAVISLPNLPNYRLEYVLAVLGKTMPPQTRAHSVAQLYVALHNVVVLD